MVWHLLTKFISLKKLHCQCFGLRIGRAATKFEYSLAAVTMGTKIKYGHSDSKAIPIFFAICGLKGTVA
jgi:hypothetical protein